MYICVKYVCVYTYIFSAPKPYILLSTSYILEIYRYLEFKMSTTNLLYFPAASLFLPCSPSQNHNSFDNSTHSPAKSLDFLSPTLSLLISFPKYFLEAKKTSVVFSGQVEASMTVTSVRSSQMAFTRDVWLQEMRIQP